MNPETNQMERLPADETKLTLSQRNWTKFHEGEELSIKGIPMYIHEIGETRMVLKFKK
jgi:hypothetical protein